MQDWYEFIETNSCNLNPFSQENILCHLADYGLLKVSGTQASKLLQGQLTCDVDKLTDTQSVLSAQCNSKGRVISLFYLFLFRGSYYLCMPRQLISITLAALKKYAIFYKVELSDESDKLAIIGYSSTSDFRTNSTDSIQIPVSSDESKSSKRFIIIGEFSAVKSIWKELATLLYISNVNTWHELNIIEGIPTIFAETSEKFLPHEINLEQLNAISLEKGCYTGQEIIARMHYRGKQKNRMVQATIASLDVPQIGSDIHAISHPHPSGMIVNVTCQNEHHYRVLLIANESDLKSNHLYFKNKENLFTITE